MVHADGDSVLKAGYQESWHKVNTESARWLVDAQTVALLFVHTQPDRLRPTYENIHHPKHK